MGLVFRDNKLSNIIVKTCNNDQNILFKLAICDFGGFYEINKNQE